MLDAIKAFFANIPIVGPGLAAAISVTTVIAALTWLNVHFFNSFLTGEQIVWIAGLIAGSHAVNNAANTVPVSKLKAEGKLNNVGG